MRPDVDAVTALVERVAAVVVAPRFRDLRSGEVREKSPGDLVTVVDTEAERQLTDGLLALLPGAVVVGEEATAADGSLLALLEEPQVFVVDPLDGTQAFVAGLPDHAVMVAYLEHGDAVAGWICLPARGTTLVAERGSGAWRDGRPLTRSAPTTPPRVRVARGHLPPHAAEALRRCPTDDDTPAREAADDGGGTLLVQQHGGRPLWSGAAYADLALGTTDALVYWRTWPWDHAPGAVLVRELGGSSRRLSGARYRPAELGEGVVVAADERTDAEVRRALGLGAAPVA